MIRFTLDYVHLNGVFAFQLVIGTPTIATRCGGYKQSRIEGDCRPCRLQ